MSADPNFPDRPDHPDFQMMSAAVQQQDGYIDRGMTLDDVFKMADFDLESLMYMAKQRGLRMHTSAPRPTDEDEEVGTLAAGWIDGFLVGLKVGDARQLEKVTQVLDGSGNRRQGGKS